MAPPPKVRVRPDRGSAVRRVSRKAALVVPLVALPAAALLAVNESCGGSAGACTPGATQACIGVASCSGGQVCEANGTAWGPCDCGNVGLEAGTPDASPGGGEAGDSGPTLDGAEGTLADATSGGSTSGSADSSSQDGNARPQRCNDAGTCTCFNIASLGYGAPTEALTSTHGTGTTEAFVSYLNTQGNALAFPIGCGTDTGCESPAKPTLNATFLAQYDVLIFQWMVNGVVPATSSGGDTGDPSFDGGGYWAFSSDELTALKTWVQRGGGVIVLSGYDFCPSALAGSGCTVGSPGELGPTNQVLQALTDMSFTPTVTYGVVETGNAELCLGYLDPVTGWADDSLGQNITQVGALHGRGINAGTGTVDCNNPTFGVSAAHEDVGLGHVYVYTDKWVTSVNQWDPATEPAAYCSLDGSTAGGNVPAVQIAYQVPQFWLNAIGYASQATGCAFSLRGATR